MTPRPNLRLTKFDEFERALRDDPNDDGQGKSRAQETADSLRMLVVASAVALAVLLIWGLLYVVAVRPLSVPVTQEARP